MHDVIFWLDVETSGLSVHEHELLEIAAIITDLEGTRLMRPYTSLVKPQSSLPVVIETASPEARAMHESNRLWGDLWEGTLVKSRSEVSQDLIDLIETVAPDSTVIPGGTSVNHDLAFVRMELPDVAQKLSHQVIDTTTLKLVNEHFIDAKPFIRLGAHRALPDTWDALEEYRTHINRLRSLNGCS